MLRRLALGLLAALLLAHPAAATGPGRLIFLHRKISRVFTADNQTIHFGAKTLARFGADSMGYTGTKYVGIDAGTCGGAFIVSANKLVPAGTSGSVPTFTLSSCTTTVREYSDAGLISATGKTSALTITVDANKATVAPSSTMGELVTTLAKTGSGQLSDGDSIVGRSGTYGRDDINTTVQLNALSLPAWTSGHLIVTSETPDTSIDANDNYRRGGGMVIHRIRPKMINSGGCASMPIDFEDVDFAQTSASGSIPSSIVIVSVLSCVQHIRLYRVAVYASTAPSFWSGVQGISILTGYAEVHDSHFWNLEQGVAVGGTDPVVAGNVFESMSVDAIKLSKTDNPTVTGNLSFAVRHDLNPCGHNDTIQLTYNNENLGDVTYRGGLIKDNYSFPGTPPPDTTPICSVTGKNVSDDIHGFLSGDFFGTPTTGTFISDLVVENNGWYTCTIPGYTTGGSYDSTMRFIAGLCPVDSPASSDNIMKLSFSGYYRADCVTPVGGGTKNSVRGTYDHFIINAVSQSYLCATETPHPGAVIDSTITSRVWDRFAVGYGGLSGTVLSAFPYLSPTVHSYAGAIHAWTPARGGGAMNADGSYAGPLFPANDFGEVCDNDGTVFDPTVHCTAMN